MSKERTSKSTKGDPPEARTPAFRAFLREVETKFGKLRRVTARDVPMWAVSAPKLEQVGIWARKARAVGGAATLYYEAGEPEIRIVAGKLSQLTALFSAKLYESGKLAQAVQSLDDASGVTFDYIADNDAFYLRLARPCVRPDVFAKAFGEVFVGTKGIQTALRRREWLGGARRQAD
ncbi:MAG TPA: hypothetical protein VL326_09975 [Kofleriaceae bacterium]|nr:hypothetical protein [Kofleriaceae bacterium]